MLPSRKTSNGRLGAPMRSTAQVVRTPTEPLGEDYCRPLVAREPSSAAMASTAVTESPLQTGRSEKNAARSTHNEYA